MSKSIQVGIRVKPSSNTALQIWEVDSKSNQINHQSSKSEFHFNRVFNPETQTYEIYQEMADDVVQGFMEGYNGTIFAYGSTGSGKTFTMMGDEDHPGITPLAVQHIFDHIRNDKNRKYIVTIAYFEIYNETIKDLLVENSERAKRIVFSQRIAHTYEDVLIAIKGAEENRATGATSMNEHSSRSHAIIRITLESAPINNPKGTILKSILNLIDLAGSECQKDTNAEGSRQREASNINKSLLALSNLINALQNGKSVTSYRDSKLTLYLQNSLGGNAQTVIICTMSLENNQQSTSKSTLQFATKAMKIKNQVKANEIKSDKVIIEEQREEINRLIIEIENLKEIIKGNGVYSESENLLSKKTKNNRNSLSYELSDDSEVAEMTDSFSVTEELPVLPKKKKCFMSYPTKADTNEDKSFVEEDIESSDPIDLTPSLNSIGFEPSPIVLPKKQKRQLIEITEEDKISDAEAELQAEQLSRAILERNAPLIDSQSDSSGGNQFLKNKELIEELTNEKCQLLLRISELEMQVKEKDALSFQITELEKQVTEKDALTLHISELEKQMTEKEMMLNQISQLEKQLSERDQISKNYIEAIKQKDEDINQLKKFAEAAKEAELLKLKISEYENSINEKTKENNDLIESVKNLEKEGVLKEARIKGANINLEQTKHQLQQKDSLMARYSDEMEKQKEGLLKKIEALTKENTEIKLQISQISNQRSELQNQNSSSNKNDDYSNKYDQFSTKLEESNKKYDLLLHRNQELIDEKRLMEKKYAALINSKNQSSIFCSRFEKNHANTDKDNTEIIMDDSLTCSSILQKDTQTPIISPMYPRKQPLQLLNPNPNVSNQVMLGGRALLEKIQNNVKAHKMNYKKKLNIEINTIFELVHQPAELDSFPHDDTMFSKISYNDDNSFRDTFDNRKNKILTIRKMLNNSNEFNNVSLFDYSDSSDESASLCKNEIRNAKRNSSCKSGFSGEDSILFEKNKEDEDEEETDQFASIDLHRNEIEIVQTPDYVSDFLCLLNLLINLFLCIGLFLID